MTDEQIVKLYRQYQSYPMSYDDMDTIPHPYADSLVMSASDKELVAAKSWYEFQYLSRYGK